MGLQQLLDGAGAFVSNETGSENEGALKEGAENSDEPKLLLPAASFFCDKLLNASGEMATISTPCGVSRVDSTMASPPTCWRTSLSASVVLAAMNFWGPMYYSALGGAGL